MTTSYVYFIRPVGMPGPIKIGHSATPFSRLGLLAAWSPFPLELVATIEGTRALEINIHDCFADDWSHREWFFPSRRLVEFVQRIAAGVLVEQAIDLTDKRGKRPRSGRDMSDSDLLCGVYNKRIAGAVRRAKRLLGPEWVVDEPEFVTNIMMSWRGHYEGDRSRRGPQPSFEALAQVDTFLRDPAGLALKEKRAAFIARHNAKWAITEAAPC